MKADSNTHISYQGIVTLTLIDGKNKLSFPLHNQGTTNLGLFFSKSLAGYYLNNQDAYRKDRPQWFMFEYKDNSSDNWNPLLANDLPFTAPTYIDMSSDTSTNNPENTIGKVRFVAAIPSSSARINYSLSGRDLRISMYDVSKKLLAYIEGSSSEENDVYKNLKTLYEGLRGGQDAAIDWSLYITNK